MKKHKVIIIILAVLLALESVFIAYLLFRRPKKLAPIPVAVAPQVKGKIAIVLDDWGYNTRNLKFLDNLKYPLTFSVLPNLPYSASVARQLNRRGFEVILHLPMEPREEFRLEKGTVIISMDAEEIRRIIEADLKSVNPVKGVSNHMGSRATADLRTIKVVFKELKKKRLYFLDSLVAGSSVCQQVAKEERISFAVRDVFLDNEEDPAYIRGQINQLKVKAEIHGYAVGIGHDRKNTLEVLRETMPQLAKEGYRFVFVSEVAR